MLNEAIVKAVAVTAELTGARLSEGAIEVMVEHLSAYDTDAVLDALHRCQIELRGPLSLGAVMDRLDDGHLGPETAWALVGGLSEDDSVVWTDEIAQAFGVARPILHDKVGARMAFLEDYRARVSRARMDQRVPVWWASLGFAMSGRVTAVKEALEKNRLSAHDVKGLLPPHEWPAELLPVRPALEAAPRDIKALVEKTTDAMRPPADGR